MTLSRVAERFGLSAAEVDLLLIALAPELEPRYETLYAYLQDDVTRKRPSVDLALNLICRSEREKLMARRFLSPAAPLIHLRILELLEEPHDRNATLLRKFLKIEDSTLRFLLEHPPGSLPIGSFHVPHTTIDKLELDSSTRTQLDNLATSVPALRSASRTVVRVVGSDKSELHQVAAALTQAQQRPLITVELQTLERESTDLNVLIRDLLLFHAVLAVFATERQDVPSSTEDPKPATNRQTKLWRAIEEFDGHTILLGPENIFGEMPPNLNVWKIEVKVPAFEQRRGIWEAELAGTSSDADAGRLADTFRFGGSQIRQAITLGHSLASLRNPSDPKASMSDLLEAGRAVSGSNLRRFATVIQPRYSWADIVLPDDKRHQLEHIATRVKHRRTVHYDWGFSDKLSRGKGLNVLFAGQSGVGKTMATEVLASDLSLVLFQIDLSSVVSKYIGETEKHLSAIFHEAAR